MMKPGKMDAPVEWLLTDEEKMNVINACSEICQEQNLAGETEEDTQALWVMVMTQTMVQCQCEKVYGMLGVEVNKLYPNTESRKELVRSTVEKAKAGIVEYLLEKAWLAEEASDFAVAKAFKEAANEFVQEEV